MESTVLFLFQFPHVVSLDTACADSNEGNKLQLVTNQGNTVKIKDPAALILSCMEPRAIAFPWLSEFTIRTKGGS